ncbi:glycoside hydrolase family 15 protein [Deminuibacter soli]|uniref:glycoside hydrolase family 15 protein n=1 Tax=Deminuibacter soli TaxID=2291815 RepID=UPI001FE2AA91|nr:glycoside hydrolase family 15 protein [Deminuibacter soli]
MKHRKRVYEPIENYGIIGNMRTVALVSLSGSVDFMSFPQFDSPAVFAALLDAEKGGYFSIEPQLKEYHTKQLYIPGTAILLTRFFAADGISEITDYMPVLQPNGRCAIVRKVTAVRGAISFHMHCCPRFNYATTAHTAKKADHSIVFAAEEKKNPISLRLLSDVSFGVRNTNGYAAFTLQQSQEAWFVLELVEDDAAVPRVDIEFYKQHTYRETIAYWRGWLSKSTYEGQWSDLIFRSAITLKLLTSSVYGSVVAAPTFSLPEVIGGNRNWDYRYTWTRDAAFTMYAFLRLGFIEEATAFINWIEEQCLQHDALRLIYGVDGHVDLEEKELTHLEGYKGSKPVRIGNAANEQLQLDIFGELLDTIYIYEKENRGSITFALWTQITKQVQYVIKHWKQADHGIWEIRSEKKVFLHTQLMCWVAVDRAMKLANLRSFPYPLAEWQKHRDEMYQSIYHNFWNEKKQAWVQHTNSDAVDASVLLMLLMRFVSPQDKRWIATMKVIDRELRLDVLIYRYRNNPGNVDGLDGEEGTFNMCSFWYIECLSKCGYVDTAIENFEKMQGYANHLGLFSEQLSKG